MKKIIISDPGDEMDSIEKTKKIYVRIAFADIVVPIDELSTNHVGENSYIVGHEYEDGTECDSCGNPLPNQT